MFNSLLTGSSIPSRVLGIGTLDSNLSLELTLSLALVFLLQRPSHLVSLTSGTLVVQYLHTSGNKVLHRPRQICITFHDHYLHPCRFNQARSVSHDIDWHRRLLLAATMKSTLLDGLPGRNVHLDLLDVLGMSESEAVSILRLLA